MIRGAWAERAGAGLTLAPLALAPLALAPLALAPLALAPLALAYWRWPTGVGPLP